MPPAVCAAEELRCTAKNPPRLFLHDGTSRRFILGFLSAPQLSALHRQSETHSLPGLSSSFFLRYTIPSSPGEMHAHTR